MLRKRNDMIVRAFGTHKLVPGAVALGRLAGVAAAGAVALACSVVAPQSIVPSVYTDLAEKAALSSDTTKWRDVTGQVWMSRDWEGAQFGPVAMPGIGIGYFDAKYTSHLCTIGPAVVAGSKRGFLTAGHCTADLGPTKHYLHSAVDLRTTLPIVMGSELQAENASTPRGWSDSGVIWTGAVDPAAATIAGKWPVDGVMTVDDVRSLPVGTPVCINGARSGVVCSPLISAVDKIRYRHVSDRGDSGASVFLVDASTGRATLIGLHRGYDTNAPTVGEATYLEPVLQRLGASALTAP